MDGVPTQSELVDHPGREVLHQGIGHPNEPVQQIHALGPGQVQSDRSLAHVGVVKGRPVLPPLVIGGSSGRAEPHPIGPLYRLDVDDIGPQRRQNQGSIGAGPEGGHVHHPDPVQGQGIGRSRQVGALTTGRGI